jgi:muconolactone delta-isomerase
MATTGKTTVLYNALIVGVGTTFQFQETGGRMGTVQCDMTDSATEGFKMEIQGRATPSMNWAILGVFDETDMDENDAALLSVRIMPEMRAEVTAVENTPTTLVCTLVE